MNRKAALAAAGGVLVVAGVAGWQHGSSSTPNAAPQAVTTSASTPPAGPSTTRSAPSGTRTSPARIPTSQTVPPHRRPPATYTVAPAPSQAPIASRAAKRATAFMEAYARPPATGPASFGWWQSVEAYLTPAAAKRMRHTKPQTIPFTRVTGTARMLSGKPAQGGTKITVRVPTNAGPWVVTLRQDRYDHLLVDTAASAGS